jgi:membrane-bound serine protease (ClpP class)
MLWCVVVGMAMVLAAACGGSETPKEAVHVLKADGDVGPVMVEYIGRGISEAEKSDAKLIVIEMDTPGGRSDSMRTIVQKIEASTVPVAVYVYPPGARAASAGTFITMAGHIAAMAPSTNIGAASPINSDGSDIGGTLGTKVMNDAVAFIRSIADLRGRNADWAEQAVRKAVAVNSAEAVKLHVVDFQAGDLHDLLKQSDGRTVTLESGTKVTLSGLESAAVAQTDKSAWEQFLDVLSDPTLASILIGLGFVALIIELSHPGLVAPGVLGAIAIVLGFVGLGELPINSAGLALIGIGLVCLAMELFFTSGVLGTLGVISLVIGGIIAFHGAPSGARPSTIAVVILIVFAVGMVASLAVTVMRVRNRAAPMGTKALLGKIAIARTALAPEGYVFVQGERWRAAMEQGNAQIGDRVRIVGADGFRLRVTKEERE